MAQGLVTHEYLEDIADAIREKLGTQDTYTPAQMADAIRSIGGPEIVPWATGTDEQIAAMIQAAHNGDIDLQTDGGWAVGDIRTISLPSFTQGSTTQPAQDVDLMITSFDDYGSVGCVLQIDFKDMLSTQGNYYDMSNLSGLIGALPLWLSDALIPVSNSKLNLSSTSRATNGYYATQSNRIKHKGKGGVADYWWTSTHSSSSADYINDSGNLNYKSLTNTGVGCAPFGCL